MDPKPHYHAFCQLETKLFVAVKTACDTNQNLSEVGQDAPVAGFARIGESAARHWTANSHVVELAGNGTQTRFDVSQAFAKSQLCESQDEKLIPDRKNSSRSDVRRSVAHNDGKHGVATDPSTEQRPNC